MGSGQVAKSSKKSKLKKSSSKSSSKTVYVPLVTESQDRSKGAIRRGAKSRTLLDTCLDNHAEMGHDSSTSEDTPDDIKTSSSKPMVSKYKIGDIPVESEEDSFLVDIQVPDHSQQSIKLSMADDDDDIFALDLSQLVSQPPTQTSPAKTSTPPILEPAISQSGSTVKALLHTSDDEEDVLQLFPSKHSQPTVSQESPTSNIEPCPLVLSHLKNEEFGLRNTANRKIHYAESEDSNPSQPESDHDFTRRKKSTLKRKVQQDSLVQTVAKEISKKKRLQNQTNKKVEALVQSQHQISHKALNTLDFTLEDVKKELQDSATMSTLPELPVKSLSENSCPHCHQDILPHFWNKARRKTFEKMKQIPRDPTLTTQFCALHKRFSNVYPTGIQSGYPTRITAKNIKKGLGKIKNELELLIQGKEPSVYRDMCMEFYEKLGSRKAKSNIYKIERFRSSQCGYYGRFGASIILQQLKVFFVASDPPLLTKQVCKPQTVLEYLQDVLVPEAAARLIAMDRTLNVTQAIQLMKESSEYGQLMFDHSSEDE